MHQFCDLILQAPSICLIFLVYGGVAFSKDTGFLGYRYLGLRPLDLKVP